MNVFSSETLGHFESHEAKITALRGYPYLLPAVKCKDTETYCLGVPTLFICLIFQI